MGPRPVLGAGVAAVFDLCTAYWFDDDGEQNYLPRHGAHVSLVFDGSNCCFKLTDPHGVVWTFSEEGDFLSRTSLGGSQEIDNSYDNDGKLQQATRQAELNGETITDRLNYQYHEGGPHDGLLQSITFSRTAQPAPAHPATTWSSSPSVNMTTAPLAATAC